MTIAAPTAEDVSVLFQPDRHEPLSPQAWDDAAARSAIVEIAADAERCFDAAGWWPEHPLDAERPVGPEPSGIPDLYLGRREWCGRSIVWNGSAYPLGAAKALAAWPRTTPSSRKPRGSAM